MNDRTGNDTRGSGKRGGSHGSGGAAIAGILGTDGHDGNHGFCWGRDVGLGKQARVEGNHTGLFRGGVNGGGVRRDGPAWRDVDQRDRISAGGTQRAGFGVMRFFSWLGAGLGCGKTTEGAGVMAKHAPRIRFAVLAAVTLVALQWALGGWMDSIEARLWLYNQLQQWGGMR